MNTSQIPDLVRRYFDTYRTGNRAQAENQVGDEFTFTSPYDDHIDRTAYFERCWSLAGTFEYHDLKKVFAEGDECFVLYEAKTADGATFRNTEFFRVEDDRIRSVEVFFGLPPNAAVSPPAEDRIRAIVEGQIEAIRDKDADAIMVHFAPGVLSFDVVLPLRNQGAGAVRKRLETWFAAYNGPIHSEIRDLEISAQGDLAFCYGLQRFTGTMTSGTQVDMWVRVTMCLRKIDGQWLIIHQHMSDPFDPENGQALTGLTP